MEQPPKKKNSYPPSGTPESEELLDYLAANPNLATNSLNLLHNMKEKEKRRKNRRRPH